MLVLLVGCGGAGWEEARAACDLDTDETLDWEVLLPAADGGINGLTVSTTCADTLIDHLGGNTDALLRALGDEADLGTHIEAVRVGGADIDGVTTAVWGLLGTLGLDADAPLAQVLYEDVVTRASGIAFFRDDAPINAGMAMQGWPANSLRVPMAYDTTLAWVVPPWRADIAAAGLFHESHHAELDGIRHVTCEAPAITEGRFCDADTDGTYGATFLTLWAGAVAAHGGDICGPAESDAAGPYSSSAGQRFTRFPFARPSLAAWR